MVRVSGRVGASLPVAIGAVVLMTTVAFGAAAFQATSTPDGDRDVAVVEPTKDPEDAPDLKPDTASEPTKAPESTPKPDLEKAVDRVEDGGLIDETEPTKAPDATPKPEPKPEATPKPEPKPDATPKPEPKPEATPKPEPKPTPKPSGPFELAVKLGDGGRVIVDWTTFTGDGFSFYKVVRSTDATVAFPAGEHDSVIGATEDRELTVMKDGEAVAGATNFYRVFAIRKTEAGYTVLAATNVAKVAVPADEPAPIPEPSAMWIEAEITDAGVVLHWEPCGADGFVAYKVVRSAGPNPSYLPGTDGSQVLAAIEGPAVTSFTDGDVSSGQTWWYRVQSIGYVGDQKVVLGQTEAIQVIVP
jgi:hypothetical protein